MIFCYLLGHKDTVLLIVTHFFPQEKDGLKLKIIIN